MTVTRTIPNVMLQCAMVMAVTAVAGCGSSARTPRPTILTEASPAPPPPPPEPNEERLQPAELQPASTDPVETPPGDSLGAMARRALDGAQADIIRCYAEILPSHPDADGSVEIQIDVSNDGAVSRLTVDQLAHGGLESAVACFRRVIEALHVRDVSPNGHYVSRVYTFHNPPIERQGAGTATISPPPPAPRVRRGRHGAAAAQVVAAASPSPPPASPGALRPEEIRDTIAGSPALAECLRRARGASGPGRFVAQVSGRGVVESATFESASRPLASRSACFVSALRATPFRASGTQTRIQQAVLVRR